MVLHSVEFYNFGALKLTDVINIWVKNYRDHRCSLQPAHIIPFAFFRLCFSSIFDIATISYDKPKNHVMEESRSIDGNRFVITRLPSCPIAITTGSGFG